MLNMLRLSAEGAYQVLRRLSTGDAKFKHLNQIVKNTRTLTRRLREMELAGWIKRVNGFYSITEEGFEALMTLHGPELKLKRRWVNVEEFKKLRHDWLRIPLKRLVELLSDEFREKTVSIALYGSSVSGSFKMGESDVDMLYITEGQVKNLPTRENEVFKRFRSTFEYTAFDRWFKTKGFYGYPEVTVTHLRRSEAQDFQPIYLDMTHSRAILYDKDGFLESLIKRLQDKLKDLGSQRVERADGSSYWVLKPDLEPGEILEIDLQGE